MPPNYRNERNGRNDVPHVLDRFFQEDTDNPVARLGASGASFPARRVVRDTGASYIETGTSVLQNLSSGHGSSYHPSLAGMTYGSSNSGTPSVSTSIVAREIPRVLAFNEFNVAEAQPPRPAKFECPFDKFECFREFDNFDEWYDHSLTHFKKWRVDPPTRNHCPFCDRRFDKLEGLRSWRERMDHVRFHHENGLCLARTGRIDTELYRHLWKKEVIGERQFKDITGGYGTGTREQAVGQVYPSPPTSPSTASAPSTGGAYTESNRRRHERQPRRRGGGRA